MRPDTHEHTAKAALDRHHERTRSRGVNRVLYWTVWTVLRACFLVYLRVRRPGSHHVPRGGAGGVILAANHRSFLDPFVIGCCVRRPVYFFAKRELFEWRLVGWVLGALGAFPVRRGDSDEAALETARAVLRRGDAMLIFPEGKRVRHGSLGHPRRGVGRLALETGAPVVPVAIAGSERVRRGWRIRPRTVRVRFGRAITFPLVAAPSPRLAGEVTRRIWPSVELQWEWLGGAPPLRTAAVVGSGPMGTALATVLARAGLDVELGCRTAGRAESVRLELAGVGGVRTVAAGAMDLGRADLVALAVPSRGLPAALGEVAAGRIGPRTAVLVLSKGLVAPLGTTPVRYAAARLPGRALAWLGGPAHAAEMAASAASVVVASHDPALRHDLARALSGSGLDVEETADVTGAELAGCAKNLAALAAAAAAPAGMNAAGAAAGRLFAEVHALAHDRGADSATFAGLAGAGDLVATALAPGSRNRRAGELLAEGVSADEIGTLLGATAEAIDTAPLMAAVLEREGRRAPASAGLAALVDGRLSAEEWLTAMRTGGAERARHVA